MKTRTELVVMSPTCGTPSETFIHRHMLDLAPQHTSVIVETRHPAGAPVSEDALTVLDESRAYEWRRFDPVRIVRAAFGKRESVEYRILKKMRDHHGVRVVLCEYLDYGLKWIDAARACGLSFFVHAHGYDVSMKLKEAGMAERYRLAYSDVDGVIVVSHTQWACLVAIGIPSERLFLVPYGVDPLGEQSVRQDHKPVRCMAVGRMVGKKAPILLLEAFRRALEKCPYIELDYYGGGALFPAVGQFVHAFGLGHVIRFHGVTPHNKICEAMGNANIFLQHSWTDPVTGDQEGLPVAILEAMAHGLPVIATKHAGIPDAVVDGETGFLVEEGAVDAMAMRLCEMAYDNASRTRFGKAGFMRQRALFSWAKERQQLCDVMGIQHDLLRGAHDLAKRE